MPEGVPLADADVAAIERATLQAVPLSQAAPDLAAIDEILARYRAAGLPPVLRLPVLPSFCAFSAELQRRGARCAAPMLTQVGSVGGLQALPGKPGEVADAPSETWMAV